MILNGLLLAPNNLELRLSKALYPANYRSPRTRANSSELARTRANSARIRQQFADTHETPANSAERSPEYAERSPEFGGVRSGSPEFARTPPRTGERFARKFVRRKKSQPAFAANEVRRERGSSRTTFAANDNFGELVRQKLPENAAYSSLSRKSSPPANCCSPRTTDRRELMFAGGELMFVGHRKPNLKSYRENGQTAQAAEEPLKNRLRTG